MRKKIVLIIAVIIVLAGTLSLVSCVDDEIIDGRTLPVKMESLSETVSYFGYGDNMWYPSSEEGIKLMQLCHVGPLQICTTPNELSRHIRSVEIIYVHNNINVLFDLSDHNYSDGINVYEYSTSTELTNGILLYEKADYNTKTILFAYQMAIGISWVTVSEEVSCSSLTKYGEKETYKNATLKTTTKEEFDAIARHLKDYISSFEMLSPQDL